VSPKLEKWDTEGREISCIKRAFIAASCDVHDAAEGRGMLEEGEQVGDEAHAAVIV
jgi:hypothetical protein